MQRNMLISQSVPPLHMAEAQGERNIQDISCFNTYSQVRMDYEAKKVYAPSPNEFQIQRNTAEKTQSTIRFNPGSGTRLSDIMSREIEVKRVIDTCLGKQSRFILHTRQLAEQVSGRQRNVYDTHGSWQADPLQDTRLDIVAESRKSTAPTRERRNSLRTRERRSPDERREHADPGVKNDTRIGRGNSGK